MLTMRDVREIKKVIREPYYSIRRDKISELCEVIERQQEALKWYANKENWNDFI